MGIPAPLLLLLSLLSVLQSGQPAELRRVDRIAAVVNEAIITQSELEQLIQYKGFRPTGQGRQRFLEEILDDMINQRLIEQASLQTPDLVVTGSEIERQMAAFRARFESSEEYLAHLESMSLSEQQLVPIIRRQLAVLKFVKMRFEPFIIVLPRQIQEYFEEELVPELKRTGQQPPPIRFIEEQIRQILTLRRTNQEMDRWVAQARERADMSLLLFRDQTGPNVPQGN